MMDKGQLRAAMRGMRRALSPAQQEAAAQAVFERLNDFAAYRQAHCVMAYMACRGEMSLAPLIDAALREGKALALPRCGAQGVMTARRVEHMAQLVSGQYGIMEPGESCALVEPQAIDLVLVPGTAFDREGHRIGQGGGYYDRFLRGTQALRVGVCHDFALFERVPHEAHDIGMDAVIAPQETIVFDRNRRKRHE